MASTLRIASRVLPRVSASFSKSAIIPTRVLNSPLSRRQFSKTAVPFELVRRYTKDHEWVEVDTETKIATMGITDHAQKALGEIVYVDLPEIGLEVDQDGSLGSVESVKAASDILSPVSGTVTEVNEALRDAPKIVNDSPEDDGWVAKLDVDEVGLEQLNDLMDANAYAQATNE
ncbi:hypothetical protein TWF694_002340 [Orbilia ellipsospora]|uniref:Glycine cleavage system H protein n=1 Tax=Orbilia ellipsospora TaxID=2528407 RepID=A0AAV9X7U2_9PEZI